MISIRIKTKCKTCLPHEVSLERFIDQFQTLHDVQHVGHPEVWKVCLVQVSGQHTGERVSRDCKSRGIMSPIIYSLPERPAITCLFMNSDSVQAEDTGLRGVALREICMGLISADKIRCVSDRSCAHFRIDSIYGIFAFTSIYTF